MEDRQDLSVQPNPEQNPENHSRCGWLRRHPVLLSVGLILAYLVSEVALFFALDHRRMNNDEYYHRPAAFRACEALTAPGLRIPERFRRVLLAGLRYPPMTYVCGVPACFFLGKDVTSLRVASGLAMGLAMLCVFGMLRRLACSPGISCLGAFLFITIPCVINQSRLYMNEGVLTAMVALLYYVLTTDPELRRLRTAILGGVVLGLGMLTKWSYPVYVAPALCYLFLSSWWPWRKAAETAEAVASPWRPRLHWLVLGAIGVLLSLPFYLRPEPWEQVALMSSTRYVGTWRPMGVGSAMANLIDTLALLIEPGNLGLFFMGLALLGLVMFLVHRTTRTMALFVGAASSFLIVSTLYRISVRDAVPYSPLLAVAMGYGIMQLSRTWLRRTLWVAASFVIVHNIAASWALPVLPPQLYSWVLGNFVGTPLTPPGKAGEGVWHMKEIAETVVADLGERKQAVVFVPFMVEDFNPFNIDTYAEDQGVDLTVYAWSHEVLLLSLFSADYLVLKGGDPGDSVMLNDYHRLLDALPKSYFTAHYKLLAEFPLPDDSTATVLRANVTPMPLQDQSEMLELAFRHDARLADNPFLLIQYAHILHNAGQTEHGLALKDTITTSVEKALARGELNRIQRTFLLRNYAQWLLRVDQQKALEVWDQLETEPYQSFDLKSRLYPDILDAALFLNETDKGLRFCRKWLAEDPNNLDGLTAQAVLLARRGDDPSAGVELFNKALAAALKEHPTADLLANAVQVLEGRRRVEFPDAAAHLIELLLGELPTLLTDGDTSEVIVQAQPLAKLLAEVGYPAEALRVTQMLIPGFPKSLGCRDSDQILAVGRALLGECLALRASTETTQLADVLIQGFPAALNGQDPAAVFSQGRSLLKQLRKAGLAAQTQALAVTLVRQYPEAVRRGEPAALRNEGNALLNALKEYGFIEQRHNLVGALLSAFPERKDFHWYRSSVPSVVAHQYDFLDDPSQFSGCDVTTRTRDWIRAEVDHHAYIFPRGHGKPFVADGSYALRFELKNDLKKPTTACAVQVYLNTHGGLGPDGSDWGEFDAFTLPANTSGTLTSYTIPLRSAVEKARFVYELRFDPIDRDTSYTFELRNLQLVKLAPPLASPEPKPEGFLPFEAGADNLFSITARKPLSSSSPLVLDYAPLAELGLLTITSGPHVLFLPKGWSDDDVSLRAVGREYRSDSFQHPTTGTIIKDGTAHLLAQNAGFDIPASTTAKTSYYVSVEGLNLRPAPIILALRFDDSPTTLARFVFDKGDNSATWQEQLVTTTTAASRLRFAFVNDYRGPEGDRNAAVTRVRVIPAAGRAFAGGDSKPPAFITFSVGEGGLVSITSKRPVPPASPLVLDYQPIQQLNSIALSRGEHLLYLPEGWSQEDVTVRTIGGEYDADDFRNPREGALLKGGVAALLGQDSSFEIAVSLNAKTTYRVAVEALNGRPPPVIVALRERDSPITLAKFIYTKGDNVFSWQEQTFTTTSRVTRLQFVFINDYRGPDGDRNAVVRAVRITEIGPAPRKK